MEDSLRVFQSLVAERVVDEIGDLESYEVEDLQAYLSDYIKNPWFDKVAVASSMSYIMTLGILQEFRGKSLAKYLVQAAKRRAKAMGKSVLFLHVVEYNDAAKTMYDACGFVCLMRIPGFYHIYGKDYSSYLAAWIDPSAQGPNHRRLKELVNEAKDQVIQHVFPQS